MNDILGRLQKENSFPPYYDAPKIQTDAIDEIIRLRAENNRLRAALLRLCRFTGGRGD